MGLLLGLIVNALLLSIPIGSTLGTLFKLRPFRNDIIQQPKDHNHIIVTSACEEFHEFAQNKIGVNYTGQLLNMISLSILLCNVSEYTL